MHVTEDHRLARIKQRPSPNRDQRPDSRDISLVVIHGISLPPGRFGTGMVEDFFLNRLDVDGDPRLEDLRGVRVSSHLFIDRRGRITQFVPFDERAWHAGLSRWYGRERCNDFSIGIELEGVDDRPYTRAQYRRLVAVLLALFERYPRLSRNAVVGHQEIAPGRKTDPGPTFDWSDLFHHLWRSP